MVAYFKSILNKYPALMKIARNSAAKIPFASRLGKKFWEWYGFFEESQRWSLEEIENFQTEQIRNLLSTLVQYSPYYRERLSHLNCQELTLAEFRREVPTLTREQFRDNFHSLLSSNWKRQKSVLATTSGTTGKALQFYHSYEDQSREWAALCHQWKRVGFDPARSRRAEFRGLTANDQLIEHYPDKNYIRCSITHINRQHLNAFADAIRDSKITFFHGYPSALYLLAKNIQETGLSFPQPAAILLASEMVYDWQIDQLQMIFPASKLFAHYGCAERTVLAGWCESQRVYHVLPQYALVEIDPVQSEIIGTNLFNTLNGFLRYRMTDTVNDIAWDICPDCKRAYIPRLSSLVGRLEDFVYSVEYESWIPPALLTYPFKGLSAVLETQLVQKEKAQIIIRYTLQSGGSVHQVEHDLEHIQQGMVKILGNQTKIIFEPVDGFQLTKSGKQQWVICELGEMRRSSEPSGVEQL